MSTLRQIEANRANGSKSRGPRTPEGKQASAANSAHSTGPVTPGGKARASQNSRRHGLLAQSVILPNESRRDFLEHLAQLQARFQPADYVENHFIEIMAVADWRRKRAWCLEMARIAHATRLQEISADALATEMNLAIPGLYTSLAFGNLATQGMPIENLRRYEAGHSREYRRAYSQFKELREERQRDKKVEITERSEPNSPDLPSEPAV